VHEQIIGLKVEDDRDVPFWYIRVDFETCGLRYCIPKGFDNLQLSYAFREMAELVLLTHEERQAEFERRNLCLVNQPPETHLVPSELQRLITTLQ